MGMYLYKLMEKWTGQTGEKIIPYRVGQRVKNLILIYLIRG